MTVPLAESAAKATAGSERSRRSLWRRVLGSLARALWAVVRVALAVWGTLAIYYSTVPSAVLRVALALAFLAFAVWALWLVRTRRARLAFAAAFGVLLVLWTMIEPSHDRSWRPEVAVMPRAHIDGDRVRITGFRNFDYRSDEDFTINYEEREVLLSDLAGVDFFISFWMPGPFGHTFVSFVFDNAPPVSISIETRPEMGEGFDPVASLFKQFELIYVVGDERDIVGVRTNHRGEEVFLYPIKSSPERVRRLFLLYLERINELADRAEFYHLLKNSCTVNIVRYSRSVGGLERFDPRIYLNGLVDGYLYATGRIDTQLPFQELRERSRITAAAQAAGADDDFSARIRDGLPAETRSVARIE